MSAPIDPRLGHLGDIWFRVTIACGATFFALLAIFQISAESMYGWEASTPSAIVDAGLYLELSVISLAVLLLGRGAGIRLWRVLAAVPVLGLMLSYAGPTFF
jgi:hypothetical protein